MGNGFEFLTRGGIREYDTRKNVATQRAFVRNDLVSKGALYFGKRGLRGFDDTTSQLVGILNHNPALGENVSRRGFAHANATRQPE